jgi:tRNA U34 5-methylaminomethyl-2-thiouridine-forming methyltransferase MnmC
MNALPLTSAKDTVMYANFYDFNKRDFELLDSYGVGLFSVADFMRRRLEVLDFACMVRDAWWNNAFDTSNPMIYHPDGRVKLIKDFPGLNTTLATGVLVDGALILPSSKYESLDGLELSRDKVQSYHDRPFSEAEMVNNEVWRFLAGYDAALLKEYAHAVSILGTDTTNIDRGVYFGESKKHLTVRRWYMDGLEHKSFLDGSTSINDPGLCFVAKVTDNLESLLVHFQELDDNAQQIDPENAFKKQFPNFFE